jgi:PAS domain S-box-containing protein
LLSGNQAQAQLWTRGRCIEEGYESLALIVLRSGEQSLGLLQLNDKRKERFSIEVITFWERMADYLDVALSKFSAQEALGESEKLYKELVENANSAIIRWRSDGTVTFFNEYAQAFFGYSAKEAIGRHVSFLLPRQESDGADLSGFVQDIVNHPQKYLNTINENICRDGRSVWMAWTNKPIGNHGGQREILAIGSDVTEQKAAEQALRRFNENLEQQVAERTALAESRARQLQALAVELIESEERERRRISDLLHEDLQQILASAKLTLESTRHADPDLDRVQELLEESIHKSRHLSHELSPAVLHYSDLGAALAWLIRQMRDQFRLDVHLEMAPNRPLESAPLKVFLFRAVKELLFNIVKHAGVKTAQVKLAGSDHQLFITVSDSGKGFDTAMLERYTPSAGLGLLSLRERASYIGGSLTIESTPGQGSRLMLRVPAHMNATPPAALSALEATLQGPPATVPIDGGPACIRVLFADDHKVMRQGLIHLVSGQPNIQVVGEAANGREALELARKLRPNTIVMDISMPEMDGIEATRRITAELPDIRVIGLSMHEDERAAREMRAAGAEDFVVKTASVTELVKTICGDHKRATNLRS